MLGQKIGLLGRYLTIHPQPTPHMICYIVCKSPQVEMVKLSKQLLVLGELSARAAQSQKNKKMTQILQKNIGTLKIEVGTKTYNCISL